MSKDYIIFSSIDWDVLWQLHQQLATSLIRDNNRVLFIENTGVRNLKISDSNRLIKKIKSRLNSFAGINEINNKLSILIPILFPFPYSRFFTYLNYLILKYKIKRWMKVTNFKDPTIITFLPTPLMHKILDSFNSSLKIYYCANHMAKGSIESIPLRKWEDRMFKKVDTIFSISTRITQRALPFNKNIAFFPPGVDFEKFNSNLNVSNLNLSNLKNKLIVGYIGAITKVIDINLIYKVASKLTDLNFVFVGPVLTNIDKLKTLNNIYFLGEKKHDQLPFFLKEFNIGIIPYVVNDFTDSVYCCKLNEYLSVGLPVISTGINEINVFNKKYKIVEVANNEKDFIKKIKNIIENDNKTLKDERIKVAKENSWDKRFDKMNSKINDDYQKFIVESRKKSNSFKEIYIRNRKKYFYLLSTLLLFYVFIFYTPFFWYAGNKLVISELAEKSDAIVVFSGDGESSYENSSYQRRAIDSLKYFNDKYTNKIILSSGRGQTIKEVEILRALLVDKGVPRDSIYIFEEYPSSTYHNVIMVRNYLRENGINKVMFITSPYHTKRAQLIWNKNAPDINIIIPTVMDTPGNDIQWNTNTKKIKIIVYEYLSILYNWIRNRL